MPGCQPGSSYSGFAALGSWLVNQELQGKLGSLQLQDNPGQEGKTQLPSPAWLSSAPLQLVINSLSPEKTSRITKPNSSPEAFLELHHHKPKENEDFQPRVAARTLPQAQVPPATAEMGKAPGRTWKHGKDAGLPPPQQRGFAPASRGTSRPRDKGACYLLTPPGSGEAAGEGGGKEAEQQTQRRRRKTRGLQPALKSPKKRKKKERHSWLPSHLLA